MSTQFRMDSVPGSLVVVGGTYEPWLAVLEKVGWRCTQVADLRKADALFVETGPCIGIVDLSHDEFSLNGIANLVSSHKQVRWLAFIREAQLSSDTICQFIVNFCIDFFTAPIPDAQFEHHWSPTWHAEVGKESLATFWLGRQHGLDWGIYAYEAFARSDQTHWPDRCQYFDLWRKWYWERNGG